jgi:hypothetical protein
MGFSKEVVDDVRENTRIVPHESRATGEMNEGCALRARRHPSAERVRLHRYPSKPAELDALLKSEIARYRKSSRMRSSRFE